jgi:hypothetical protein
MESIQTRPATVTLELRVPRGDHGDLTDGVAGVVERVDGVRRTDAVEVDDLRPALADLYVTATVQLELDGRGGPDATRDRLEDGFGVVEVESVVLAADEP